MGNTDSGLAKARPEVYAADMTDGDELKAQIDAVRAQVHSVYRVRGGDLAQVMRRAGRMMPRHVRKAGRALAQVEPMLGNPKLERTLDFDALKAAHATLTEHLESVDVADIRRGRLLALAGLLSFYVIFVAVCFIIWMRWAGQI